MEDLFNKDITVINKYFNEEKKLNEYKISYIKGFWNEGKGVSINGTHLVKEDSVTAIILINDSRNEAYQEPQGFEKEQKTWTLKAEDYLVKGKVETFSSIAALIEEYGNDVLKISKVVINDTGSEDMWNFEIEGA